MRVSRIQLAVNKMLQTPVHKSYKYPKLSAIFVVPGTGHSANKCEMESAKTPTNGPGQGQTYLPTDRHRPLHRYGLSQQSDMSVIIIYEVPSNLLLYCQLYYSNIGDQKKKLFYSH